MLLTTAKNQRSIEIKFYDDKDDAVQALKYVVIISRYQDQWLFVKHRDRSTWEVPGGHIEVEEAPDHAARRELIEETSADDFSIQSICNYSVERDGFISYGRLYFAQINHLVGSFEHEIQSVGLFQEMPEHLTYPDIQPHLMEHVIETLKKRDTK